MFKTYSWRTSSEIEVIRGPGASVWGANAVNGVINIITKSAADTHGVFAEAGAGTEESGFTSARYGWKTKNGADVRLYGKWFERDQAFIPGGTAHDDWRMGRGGGRADWDLDPSSKLTIQGDAYLGKAGNENVIPIATPPFSSNIPNDTNLGGGNALVRYTYTYSEDSDWSLQAYYDRTERHLPTIGFGEDRDTIDVDFQYRFKAWERHAFIWGAAYRNTSDNFTNAPDVLALYPSSRSDNLFSCFAQDEIALSEDLLYLTLGAKFLYNDYTQFEFQPTTRLLWTPTETHSIWAAYSRAVRTPSRVADDVRLTLLPSPSTPGVFPVLTGNRAFESENLDAYELGIRTQVTPEFSWDLATFYFKYTDLQSTVAGTPVIVPGTPPRVTVPLYFANTGSGTAYGGELATNHQLRSWWRLTNAYTLLWEDLEAGGLNVNNSPRNQLYTQSSWDLPRNFTFDVIGRYMDRLKGQDIPSYVTMDLRVAWTPNKNLQWSVVGRNLLDADHPEFGFDRLTGNVATNVQRELYSVLTYRY